MGWIGYKGPAATPDALALDLGNPSNYRTYVPDAAVENGWATSMSFRIGKTGPDALSVRGGVLSATPNPDAIIQQTATFNPGVLMTSGADGSFVMVDLPGTIKIYTGDILPLGAIATGTRALLGMAGAASIPGHDNYNFYSLDDSSLDGDRRGHFRCSPG